VKWAFKAGGPIVTSPTILDGVVYIAALDGHLYAIDQETGKEKWNFKSRMPIASTPAVLGNTLYFVSSAGSLAALDIKTGQPRWVYAIEYERKFEAKNLHGYPSAAQTIPDAWDLFTSSPTVANGKVYFGGGDGNVYAVDAQNGALVWKFSTKDVVHSSPAVVNNVVYIGSWDSYLYAIDGETGLEKWSFKSGEDNTIHNQVGFQSSPAVVDGTVYIGCRDAHVYAIDAATGHKKWDYPTNKSWVIGTPAVRDGLVYVGTSDSSRFMALDAKTGRLRFNFKAGAYMFSSAALAGDLAYVGDHNGRLYAIEAKTGNLAWEFQTESSKRDPDESSQFRWNSETGSVCSAVWRLRRHVHRFLPIRLYWLHRVVASHRQRCSLLRQYGRYALRCAVNRPPGLVGWVPTPSATVHGLTA
jgi:outer membrane protein assembly factor BamB